MQLARRRAGRPRHRRQRARGRRRAPQPRLRARAARPRRRRARLRARRALRPARQERPDRRHLERRRRHLERAGLQERAVLPHQPRLRRARQRPGARLVRGRLGGGRARAVLGAGRGARVLRDRRPDAEGRARALHGAHRPARRSCPPGRTGCGCRRSFTTDYDEAHGHLVHRRDGRARPAAVGLPLRLLLDARVQLVRLRVGPAGLPRPGRACSRACTRRTCASASGSTPTSGSARRCSPRPRQRATS